MKSAEEKERIAGNVCWALGWFALILGLMSTTWSSGVPYLGAGLFGMWAANNMTGLKEPLKGL